MSQPLINRQSHGNFKLSTTILLTANTYMIMSQYFLLAGIQWLGKTQQYAFQKKYLAGVVNEAYNKEKNDVIDSFRKRGYCYISGDRRCDSPGHSPKYLTFSMLDQATNTIALMFVT